MTRAKFSLLLSTVLVALVATAFRADLLALGPGPDAPVLLGPSDGATGVSTTPTLSTYVTDPDGGRLTVTAMLRRLTGEEFTIIALPDTQYYSEKYPATFTAQTQWIVDNREARNIVFVTHEGDVVQTADNDAEWQRADASMRLLEIAGIPFGVGPGNHDQPTTKFNQYFGVDRFQGRSYYGGHYQSTNDNNYQLFSGGGLNFVILHLDYCPPAGVVAWASSILQSYPDRIGILTTHAYLDGSANRKAGGCTTQYLWDDLAVPNPNLRFMLSGHISNESRRTDSVGGRTVHQMLADYQERSNGGQGFLRILRFVPGDNKVYVQTYSPTMGAFETDANSQFTLDFAMATSFEEVGRVTVLEGSDAEIPAADLDPFTTYEWKVTITNGNGQTRTGPTWRFTTGAGGPTNLPPIATPLSVSVPEDASTFVTLAGSDPEGNPLTFQVMTLPAHGTLTGTAPNLAYVPAADYAGPDSFTFRVRDGQSDSAAATVSIAVQPVNDPPAAAGESYSVQSGNTLTVPAPGVLGNDSDIDSAGLTTLLAAGPAHGVLTLNANGSFTYTPTGGYAGADAFQYMANDGLAASAPVTVTFTVTPAPAAGQGNIKAITFEAGTLTDATSGADATSGSVTLHSTAPLKGSYSAALVNVKSAYLRESFTATPEVYVSFYIRLNALPSSDVQLLRILNGSSQVGTLVLRSTGQVRLRNNSSTVGADSAVLTVGQVYRVGMHQKARAGSTNNGVLEGFLAQGGDSFGAPFAALGTGSWTTSASEVRLGTITSVAVNLVLDDIRLDSAVMPLADTVAPAAPADLVIASATPGAVALSWADASSNETRVDVERAGSDGIFAALATLSPNTTTHVDTTVAALASYSYRVRAANSVGASGYSNTVSLTVPAPPAPPEPPTGLTANALSSTQVQLAWTDNSSAESTFRIERAAGGGAFVEIATVAADVVTFTDTSAAAATDYLYRVRAAHAYGVSGYSNESGVSTPVPSTETLKFMTFESGTATDSQAGADAVSGTVTFETTAPLRGTRSLKIAGSAYLQEDFSATDDLLFSFFIRLPSLPASDVRIALVTNSGTTAGNLYLRSTGQLRLRNNSTTLGADSTPLTPGVVYRVLLHQKTSTRLLEAFVAAGDTPFGAPFAASTSTAFSGSANRIRLGGTNGTLNAVLDDVRLER